MRKSLLLILVLLLTALCACAAANSEYPLDSISGRVSVNEDRYIVLTSGNLADHPDLLSAIGKTAEELQADWTERGVRLQAWQKDMKVRIEVSVVQDEDSARYYDLKAQDNGTNRGTDSLKHVLLSSPRNPDPVQRTVPVIAKRGNLLFQLYDTNNLWQF